MKSVYTLTPEQEAALERDMLLRLDADGYPIHHGNDFELHLFARKLKQGGASRAEVVDALRPLVITKVPFGKVEQYISDIVDSILVGFGNLPIFTDDGGSNGHRN